MSAPAAPAREAVTDPPPRPSPVQGDGTSGRSRLRARWRRARLPLGLLLATAVVVLSVALLPAPSSIVPYAIDNAGPDGARAVAEILRDQGVDVVATTSSAEAAAAPAGTTLAIAPGLPLTPDERGDLADAGADLVLLDAGADLVSRATDGAVGSAYANAPRTTREARCDDADASAAGTATLGGSGLVSDDPDAVLCFPGAADEGAGYAVVRSGDRTVRVLSSADVVSNGALLDAGDAALALRALGHHDRLLWYVPDGGAPAAGTDAGLLPPWVGVVGLELLLVLVVVAIWRGRRTGRLVTEDLPVVVRASETTRGRGRLYRAGGSRGHAAAGLRALTAQRLAERLGVPRTADAGALVDAVARAAELSPDHVVHLLYGPPPTDDQALLLLAHELDILESEVHPL
ncbi:DUF4350 domain-containing protein [Cellulomonas sp. PhB143]|uniref:DUF4350 domain-containing protein n=1 Tax=Cellulomonas sp. PhB143 TaxID=2485186 RepID=UPI000F9FB5C1|nr:DUF4350 domain-containing protein [Cellulomonas sp. PhB143]ROS78521.1 uncharacterized protein DUF4350 [Cellulomonas sp. PhB143]